MCVEEGAGDFSTLFDRAPSSSNMGRERVFLGVKL